MNKREAKIRMLGALAQSAELSAGDHAVSIALAEGLSEADQDRLEKAGLEVAEELRARAVKLRSYKSERHREPELGPTGPLTREEHKDLASAWGTGYRTPSKCEHGVSMIEECVDCDTDEDDRVEYGA